MEEGEVGCGEGMEVCLSAGFGAVREGKEGLRCSSCILYLMFLFCRGLAIGIRIRTYSSKLAIMIIGGRLYLEFCFPKRRSKRCGEQIPPASEISFVYSAPCPKVW